MSEIPYIMALVVVNENGDYLLLKRSEDKYIGPGEWAVVGAFPLTHQDNMKEIAKRELLDEVGITKELGDITSLGNFQADYAAKDKVITAMVNVLKVEIPSTAKIVLNNEHTEYKWVSAKQLEDLPLTESIRKILSLA